MMKKLVKRNSTSPRSMSWCSLGSGHRCHGTLSYSAPVAVGTAILTSDFCRPERLVGLVDPSDHSYERPDADIRWLSQVRSVCLERGGFSKSTSHNLRNQDLLEPSTAIIMCEWYRRNYACGHHFTGAAEWCYRYSQTQKRCKNCLKKGSKTEVPWEHLIDRTKFDPTRDE
ncbi:hypothetical protein Cob_v008875 [Colletotrichum orbiculare MAFF 240422]|uniref:Uncharacterized protein n=1 Tax=Colletotrichum orbiculare (strain 104-T / ATCC 96160 / CBS 514.97 / LARS 414 / MAFF 240422) TaxID=1213857 RepID=A0A484FIS0_COLOR|nr:hypothetical protein Cob_v008875 [Colletotrichum orbiculare MAFF 240422]